MEISAQNARWFRLHVHHLSKYHKKEQLAEVVGACGMQNTPPGAWETALLNRVADCPLPEINNLLYKKKTLLQAWSFRGAPVVFPTSESGAFLSALIPEAGEEWIYTHGIALALDYLGMAFDELLDMLTQVITGLDHEVIASKSTLDQTLAEWMLPLLPAKKRDLWNAPSMYGRPDVQTVGGAAVSFLLRPCSFLGLVVFGQREGVSPIFTSFKGWLGHPLSPDKDAIKKLARKFLHCYGPTTAGAFASWLGCSGKQARRMWATVADEVEPVELLGKKAYVLSEDMDLLTTPPIPQRELLLLGGHDPYLDQRDRDTLLADKALQKRVWTTISNPGAVVRRGEIIGIWTSRMKGSGMAIKITLWKHTQAEKQALHGLVEEYAAFRGQNLTNVDITE